MTIIKCVICHREINDLKSSHQTKDTKSIACESCVKKYGKKDVELLADLFLMYGGYEGKLKNNGESFEAVLDGLVNKLSKTTGGIDQLFTISLHHFLLHGVDQKKLKEKIETS